MSHKYYRLFFSSINSNIRIIETDNRLCDKMFLFNIKDISKNLKYSTTNYIKNYYCNKLNDVKLFNNDYVNLYGVIDILNRSKKTNSKNLAQQILFHSRIDYKVCFSDKKKIFFKINV